MDRKDLFLNSVSRLFLANGVRAIRKAYKDAYDWTDERLHFGVRGPEGKNALPYVRRALIEQYLALQAQEFGEGMSIRTDVSGNWNVRTICVNTGIEMQQYRSSELNEVRRMRRSNLRWLKSQNEKEQGLLFPDSQHPGLFAIILHGGASIADHPSYIRVEFPTSSLAFHKGSAIDLFQIEAEVEAANAMRRVDAAPIEASSPPKPHLKKKSKSVL